MENNFVEIVQIIKQSRTNAIKAVNAELINLYWNVGMYISNKLKLSDWGDKTVADLSEYIQRNNPEIKGFSQRGLYRMIQFYETYSKDYLLFVSEKPLNIENQLSVIVPTVLTQFKPADIKDSMLSKISWSHHMAIFSRCKVMEERKYYITLCIQENYSFRELERQISASLFERSMIGMPEPTKVNKELNDISYVFKDSYVFDFLNLPELHSESELQKGLLNRMKDFILELGRDFIFIGEE